MRAFLVTVGSSNPGFNSGLNIAGQLQIMQIHDNLLPKIPRPPLIVLGTGERFVDACSILAMGDLEQVPMKCSPFCGDAAKREKDGSITLRNTTISSEDYVGLGEAKGFDAWEFLRNFPAGTLFVTECELMSALGLKSQQGYFYALNTDHKSCDQITGERFRGLKPH